MTSADVDAKGQNDAVLLASGPGPQPCPPAVFLAEERRSVIWPIVGKVRERIVAAHHEGTGMYVMYAELAARLKVGSRQVRRLFVGGCGSIARPARWS